MINLLKNNKFSFFFMLMGSIFMGLGIFRGEVSMIFMKAINVCFECIGIG